MPMGFEFGAAQPLGPARDAPADWDLAQENAPFDLSSLVAAVNAARTDDPVFVSTSAPRLLSAPGASVLAVLRTDAPDPRFASRAVLILANTEIERRATASASALLASIGATFPRFEPLLPSTLEALRSGDIITLDPAEVAVLHGTASRAQAVQRPPWRTARARPEHAARSRRERDAERRSRSVSSETHRRRDAERRSRCDRGRP